MRLSQGQVPGDCASTIMSGHDDTVGAKLLHQVSHIVAQRVQAITRDTGWFVRLVVAAEIGSDDLKAGNRQGRDLIPPGIPKLWKTVQQYDQGTAAGVDEVQANAVDRCVPMRPAGV